LDRTNSFPEDYGGIGQIIKAFYGHFELHATHLDYFSTEMAGIISPHYPELQNIRVNQFRVFDTAVLSFTTSQPDNLGAIPV
jgi:hypothetical protein